MEASAVTDWASVSSVRLTLSFESADAAVSTATTGDRRLTTATTSTIALRNRMP